MSTATATTASANTVSASPATEAAGRDTSNVSDCRLFRQRTEVTTVSMASLAMLRQGTLVKFSCGLSMAIKDSTRSQCTRTASHNYFSYRQRLSAIDTR